MASGVLNQHHFLTPIIKEMHDVWKRQKEETNNAVDAIIAASPTNESSVSASLPERTTPSAAQSPAAAHIGKSLRIKGELRSGEDMHIDGQVEGSIELGDHELTVGPDGAVQASVNAKKVIILGSVKGNIHAADSVDVQRSGSLVGDIVVAGVSIAEGAYFKGSIDIQRTGDGKTRKR